MLLQLLVNKTQKNLQIKNKKLSFRLVIDRLLKNSSQRVMLRPRAMSSSSSGSLQERKNIPCRHWVNKVRKDLGFKVVDKSEENFFLILKYKQNCYLTNKKYIFFTFPGSLWPGIRLQVQSWVIRSVAEETLQDLHCYWQVSSWSVLPLPSLWLARNVRSQVNTKLWLVDKL